jgi:hypothetical protein
VGLVVAVGLGGEERRALVAEIWVGHDGFCCYKIQKIGIQATL